MSFIHRFVRGSGPDASTTLLMLHGTGGNESDLLELGSELLPGATLLSPRGKVLENGMPRFFRRLAEGVFDVDDLMLRTHELAEFIAEACAAYSLNARRVIAVGYSNGANIAASLLFLRSKTLGVAILFRPMVPFSPSNLPNLAGKSVFIAGGRQDQIANPSGIRRLAELLSTAGAAVEIHWHDGGHELGEEEIRTAQSWVARYAEEPPS
ncbi:MAG: alpha/beta hydrolase [Planctomycetes bacterium]|nr:alpha/beta hydrolase [Planctomycetota bacterium]